MRAASDGRAVWLPALWSHRRVVVVFLRHLGCRFCKQQMLEFDAVAERLEEAGVGLAYLSMGTPAHARELCSRLGVRGAVYVDPSTATTTKAASNDTEGGGESGGDARRRQRAKAYGIFSLLRGPELVRNERTAALGAALLGEGVKDETTDDDGKWPGDIFQVGGVFVLGPGNMCEFAHRSQFAGDHADVDTVVAAATGIAPSGGKIAFPSSTKWAKQMRVDEELTAPRRWPRPSRATATLCFALIGTLVVILRVVYRAQAVEPQTLVQNLVSNDGVALAGLLVVGTVLLAVALQWMFPPEEVHGEMPPLVTAEMIDRAAYEAGEVDCDCQGELETIPLVGLRDIAHASPVASPSRPGSRPGSRPSSRPPSPVLGEERQALELPADMEPNLYQDVLCYVRAFLSRPHPSVGRPGPVCPFIPLALKRNSLYFAVVREKHVPMTTRGIKSVVEHFLGRFDMLEPTSGRARQFKACIMIFPDISAADAPRLIDGIQLEMKAQFVSRGLMIGEFHQFNNSPGLRNPHFYPLRTPTPCLGFRHMVPTDLAFLNIDDVALRKKFLKSFLEVFQHSTKSSEVAGVRKAEEMLAACG